jgi:hypothetical protein
MKGAPRPLVWLAALLFALPMLHAANVLQVRFNALTLIPLYAVVLGGVLGLVAWREWGERGVLPLDAGRDSRGALRLALIFALVSMAANYFVVWGFGYTMAGDSPLYVEYGRTLFDPSNELPLLWRTLPYSFLVFLGFPNSGPFGIISLQIALSALAVFSMVWVLARRNVTLAVGVGFFLALDPVWIGTHRYIMNESASNAMFVLMLALLVSQLTRGRTVSKLELFLAGVAYAWAFYLRASNLVLLIVVVLAYLWATKTLRPLLYLVLGMGLTLMGAMLFNGWRYGTPVLSHDSAVNFDGSLIMAGDYAPENGPASQEFAQVVAGCLPEVVTQYQGDFLAYARTRESYWEAFGLRTNECFIDAMGSPTRVFTDLWFEALRANPIRLAEHQIEQHSAAFAIRQDSALLERVQLYGYNLGLTPPYNTRLQSCWWCNDARYPVQLDIDTAFGRALLTVTQSIRQPYLVWGGAPNIPIYLGGFVTQQGVQVWGNGDAYRIFGLPSPASYCVSGQPCVSLGVVASWLLWAGFVWILSRGAVRWLVSLAFVFLHWVILSTTLGYYLEPRYATMIAPLMLLIAVIGWVTIGAGLWQSLRRGKP